MATMKLGSKPEIFVLQDLTWRCTTELESDVVVEVGEMSFYLHKVSAALFSSPDLGLLRI